MWAWATRGAMLSPRRFPRSQDCGSSTSRTTSSARRLPERSRRHCRSTTHCSGSQPCLNPNEALFQDKRRWLNLVGCDEHPAKPRQQPHTCQRVTTGHSHPRMCGRAQLLPQWEPLERDVELQLSQALARRRVKLDLTIRGARGVLSSRGVPDESMYTRAHMAEHARREPSRPPAL